MACKNFDMLALSRALIFKTGTPSACESFAVSM
ncbi:MAG: hypothetical protein ACD_72C00168G0001 [uncultured bacterium]|nr:MAG: hypothetical protein ACD_72C00168G0001 [uncultured bacterium]